MKFMVERIFSHMTMKFTWIESNIGAGSYTKRPYMTLHAHSVYRYIGIGPRFLYFQYFTCFKFTHAKWKKKKNEYTQNINIHQQPRSRIFYALLNFQAFDANNMIIVTGIFHYI